MIHESCRLCAMKDVAFLPSVPWKTSPFSHEKRRYGVSDRSAYYEKCRFSSAEMRGMDPVNQPPSGQYEAQNGNYLALDHQTKSTMKIVALNHEKCRYCPLSLGNQERKESYLKKEQYEEERSSSDFIYSSERVGFS